MTKIQYHELGRGKIGVYLEGASGNRKLKKSGVIHQRNGIRPKGPAGFQYVPCGQRTGGEVFPTLAACKRSLEPDEEFTPAFAVAGMNPNDWRKAK
jgi:hypothetical protein